MVREAAARFAGPRRRSSGERRITYGELEERARGLAAALPAGGAGARLAGRPAGAPAPTWSPPCSAVLQAGGAFVPFDLRSPATRLEAAVAEVRPRFWLVARTSAPGPCVSLEREVGFTATREPRRRGRPRGPPSPPAEPAPDDLCYVYFTSGSTGRPKGIAGRLKAIDHFIRWEIETFGIGAGVRVSQLTSPAFDAFLRDAFVPLAAGGTRLPAADREVVLDGGAAGGVDRRRAGSPCSTAPPRCSGRSSPRSRPRTVSPPCAGCCWPASRCSRRTSGAGPPCSATASSWSTSTVPARRR